MATRRGAPLTWPDMTPDEILDLDTRTLWHPYSAVGGAGARVVTSAEGVRLTLGDGTEVIDG